MGSRKSFILPNGTVETDSHAMDLLAEGGKTIGYTERDRAHRPEHSIELHLLFARHIWNHPFNIVPVLVGTFHELHYMRSGDLSKQIDKFSKLLRRLDDDDTFFLISGDLSHVGIKFGDSESASSMRPDVEKHDHRFLKLAAENRSEELLEHTGTSFDPYRVCGFPPLYTWLKAFPERTGSEVAYHWWDESEMRSAVSFGTISY
ncbi:MAG: AmmeMemoRadiSam system protein B [Balneolaceae bacterium]